MNEMGTESTMVLNRSDQQGPPCEKLQPTLMQAVDRLNSLHIYAMGLAQDAREVEGLLKGAPSSGPPTTIREKEGPASIPERLNTTMDAINEELLGMRSSLARISCEIQ